MWLLGKNMLYTTKISGQAKTFRRAILAHLQGISFSAGVPPAIFFILIFFSTKNAFMFCFCIGASIRIGWETRCLPYAGFFLILFLRLRLVIFYRYVSIGKIIVLAFLHTLKMIHNWNKVVIKFTVSLPDSDFCHNKHRTTTPNNLFMT